MDQLENCFMNPKPITYLYSEVYKKKKLYKSKVNEAGKMRSWFISTLIAESPPRFATTLSSSGNTALHECVLVSRV